MNLKSGKNIIVTKIGIVFQYLWQSQRTSTVRRYVFAVTIAGILLLTGQWSQAQTIYVEPFYHIGQLVLAAQNHTPH